ncbi:hypothetical protein [Blastococcus brunescens]|uniref:Uncharacterized protein n=1 Tax=Blastococcus brunescens TaxID=1564165 RepID=A0ABZ1B0F5_9ACTN|nr:hypothetical protein [Blastococcus sp. BMG 8361]WRL64297.1 hypothetical protein U6N30_00030 [Blastococcus sp. BMG 8361]
MPPIGIALFAIAVGLETVGYVVRLTDATGPTANLLSMDAPGPCPASSSRPCSPPPPSRPWPGRAASRAGAPGGWPSGSWPAPSPRSRRAAPSTPSRSPRSRRSSEPPALWPSAFSWPASSSAGCGSSAAPSAVTGAGFSASCRSTPSPRSACPRSRPSRPAPTGASKVAAAATFVEESGEALAAVSFLIAVLVGVAPRVVLPAAWALRRSADAHTLELPEVQPARVAEGPAQL